MVRPRLATPVASKVPKSARGLAIDGKATVRDPAWQMIREIREHLALRKRILVYGGSEVVKVFLDDCRPTPAGWVPARCAEEVIRLLEQGNVTELSLDPDLGDDARGTGYEVLTWIQRAVVVRGFRPPRIRVHSANPATGQRMHQAIVAIERLTLAAHFER